MQTPTANLVPPMQVATKPYRTVGSLILSDVLALSVATGVSMLLRYAIYGHFQFFEYYLKLLPMVLVFVLVYAALDLYPGVVMYPGVALGPAEELRRLTVSTTLVFLAIGASTFLVRGGAIYSRAVFLMAWAIALFLVPIGRGLLRAVCSKRPWWGHPVLILGGGETGRSVIQALQRQPGLGLKPIAILDDKAEAGTDIAGIPVVGHLDLAPRLAELHIPYAIVALGELPRERHQMLLETYSQTFPHLLIIPDFLGTSTLWVVAKDLGGVLGLEVREQLLLPGPCRAKRLMDVTLTALGGLALLPILGVIALLIRLDSRGPACFSQERLGRGGRVFRAFKFRTMRVGAEDELDAILAANAALREEYEKYHKLRDDPRVTRVGRWLRKFSLDELPQLWNVMRGDMSLVGPRAYLPGERPKMNQTDRVILRVRPGITGLWQVTGRNAVQFAGRLAMDVYYVRNWSLWFDLYILARTCWVVLRGKGAF